MEDSFAPYYDLVYDECFGEAFWRLTAETVAVLTELLPSPGRVLDLGAGTGRLALPLALLGYDVTAIERSAGMADVLERRAAGMGASVRLSRADFTTAHAAIGSGRGRFDLAFAIFTVVNYVLTPGDLAALARRVAESLEPGGHFVFDLADRRLFASARFESSRLRRHIEVTPIGRELFRYRDRGSGTSGGRRFTYDEQFTFRYWTDTQVLSVFADAGLRLHADVSHRLRESGSRWFVLATA